MFNHAKLTLLSAIITPYLADDNMSACSSVCSDCSYQSEIDDQSKSFNFDLSNGSPIDVENFNIVHYNINSILAHDKLEQLTDICRLLNIDMLIITESKLDSNIPTNSGHQSSYPSETFRYHIR